MIRYFFLIAFRNVMRNQGYARLNISGFALGLAAFLLIMFFVFDEVSYDQFHQHHARIVRVDTELKYGGVVSAFAIAAPPVASALLTNFPEVEQTARVSPALNLRFNKDHEIIREDQVMYADPSLFQIFSFKLLAGNHEQSLSHPGAIVITERVAQKYFNTTDAVGKSMVLQNDTSLHVVTAVVADLPDQSHFHADIFLPLETLANAASTSFNSFTFTTYALLRDQQAATKLGPKLHAFLNQHLSTSMNVEAFEKGGNYIRLVLTPLDDIHLHSNKQRELEANSDVNYIYIFTTIAFLILLLACINFTNLFTARSANRGKEVGIRKVMGSQRISIMLQFLVESLVMTAISVFIALAICIAVLPIFNTLSGKRLEVTWSVVLIALPSTLAISGVVALIAGAYPAFYLSAFKPVKVLQGKLATGFKSSSVRSALVIMQFVIATVLVVSTLVILHQLEFVRAKSLGFDREQVLVIKNAGTMDRPEVLKEEAKRLPGVVNATLSGYLPTGGARAQNSISIPGSEGLMTELWAVDADYIPTLHMKLSSGRNFSDQLVTDSSGIILNKTAADRLDLGRAAIGQNIVAGGKQYQVIGVIDDFNFASLRDNISPLAMVMNTDWQASLIVRTYDSKTTEAIREIGKLWTTLNPGYPFEFSVMDDDFEATYHTEQRMQKLFLIFAVLAIVIAGIGLFGLSAYAAEQRTKELAVRKVLGASVGSLFTLLAVNFIKLVLVAVVIALPLSWIAMESWLAEFAYRANIPAWILVLSAILMLLTGGLTISMQTLKAALHNPADTLRT